MIHRSWPGVWALALGLSLGAPVGRAAPDEEGAPPAERVPRGDGRAGDGRADDGAQDASPEVRAFLSAWGERMRDVRTLRVEFVQTKKLRILRRPLVSRGTTLLRGERVLMTVRDAEGAVETALLVSDGEARLHVPRLARVEVYPLGKGAPPPTPFPLFGADLDRLPDAYRLRLEEVQGDPVLVLEPRAADSPIVETRMRFRDYVVRQVTQRTRRGDALELEVTAFERNADLSGERLELEVGPETEVVYPLGAPAGAGQ